MASTSGGNPEGEARKEVQLEASTKPKIYTASVTTKVTDDMLGAIKAAADEAGLKESEWLRAVISRALNGGAGTRILLAEVLALRSYFLTMKKKSWQGEGLTDEKLTQLIETVDARKFALADARLAEGKR
jgi:hypothetical protein